MTTADEGMRGDPQLEELKACELEMLKSFIRVCESLRLRYYLMGGTMLGAVRHQGFIPWDDDIDVGMPRKDYETFIREAQKMLPEQYFVQTHFSDPEYPYNFAKLRNSETTFLETALKDMNMNHGVFIDIFPLDFYPDEKWRVRLLEFRKGFYTSRIKEEYYSREPLKRTALGKIQLALAKWRYPDYRKAVQKKEKLLKSVKKGERIANHGGAWGAKEIVPAQWYGQGTEMKFEGIPVRVPEQYDLWLTQVYGDYRKLPPVEKRVSHHFTEVIDLKHSYRDYR